jgi:hypothetical protein
MMKTFDNLFSANCQKNPNFQNFKVLFYSMLPLPNIANRNITNIVEVFFNLFITSYI